MAKTSHENHFELNHYKKRDYFGEKIGYRLISVDRKKHRVRSSMQVKRVHISAAGRIHGGALMAFADFACGAAVFASMQASDRTATIELKTHFFQQVFEGQTLIADSSLHFRGNRIVVSECQIRDQKTGDKVAVAIGTYNVMSGEPKSRATPSRPKIKRRRSV
jgi:1,4-dihydroxy-2-naphthoyl-CoA hydrolase